MAYAVVIKHHPGCDNLRERLCDAHYEHLESAGDRLLGASAIHGDGGEIIGDMILLDDVDRENAEAFVRRDPYAEAGLIESRTVFEWPAGGVLGGAIESGFEKAGLDL